MAHLGVVVNTNIQSPHVSNAKHVCYQYLEFEYGLVPVLRVDKHGGDPGTPRLPHIHRRSIDWSCGDGIAIDGVLVEIKAVPYGFVNGVAKGYDARLDVAAVEALTLTDAAKQRRPEDTADLIMGRVQVDVQVANVRFREGIQFIVLAFPEHVPVWLDTA